MGVLLYSTGTTRFEFDDRVLTHLQLVIAAKLRRDERFMCTWTLPVDTGGGRVSIWVDPNIPLCFQYAKVPVGPVNVAWLEELMRSANSVGGLHVIPEPAPTAPEQAPDFAGALPGSGLPGSALPGSASPASASPASALPGSPLSR